jgi:hypothetical protein
MRNSVMSSILVFAPALLIAVFYYFALWLEQEPRPRFSLRTLLRITTLVAVVLGVVVCIHAARK